MCSIGEDDFGDDGGVHAMVPDLVTEQLSALSLGTCKKCGNNEELYKLSNRQAECRNCFLLYVKHKFRATLGSSKVLPKNACVVLALDDSGEALVLLDMLHDAQGQSTHKRLHCNGCVLYVCDENFEASTLARLAELRLRYKSFDFYVAALHAHLDEATKTLVKLGEDLPAGTVTALSSSSASFRAKLREFRSPTARQDYASQARKRLIGVLAKVLKCGFVFTPKTSTTLAAQFLASVALGRGGSAALDAALLDERLAEGAKLVRPLRDLNQTEVQLYLRARDLSTLLAADEGRSAAATDSLQGLTHDFLTNLQQNFSATVPTVFRTASKLAPYIESIKCRFCLSPLEPPCSNTLLAMEFSSVASSDLADLPALGDMATSRGICHACRNLQSEADIS